MAASGMSGMQSPEELEANLQQYREQLTQVEQLLLLGSDEEVPSQDLQDMYTSLAEVIQLTEDLLRDALQQQRAGGSAAQPASTSAADAGADAGQPVPKIITPPELNLPSILPASVADQIRKAQVKAALVGQAPAAWAIGARCQAQYADGEFYDATIDSVSVNGNFIVVFDGYETKDEVPLSGIRPKAEDEDGYKGVAAPKRKRVEEAPTVTEIPQWLAIKDTDDEKTKARKKKLLKSYKSKMRFANMDLAQKQKQDTWQSFLKGKATKKKTGFITGTKKESIFKVPEGVNAKVGVVGSGRGMTEYQRRQRHEFEEDDDE